MDAPAANAVLEREMDMGAPLGTDDVGCTLLVSVALQDASNHSSKNIKGLFMDILARF